MKDFPVELTIAEKARVVNLNNQIAVGEERLRILKSARMDLLFTIAERAGAPQGGAIHLSDDLNITVKVKNGNQ